MVVGRHCEDFKPPDFLILQIPPDLQTVKTHYNLKYKETFERCLIAAALIETLALAIYIIA